MPNSNSPDIKILVSYHKPSTLLKTNIFTPIHVGKALSKQSSKDGSITDTDLSWMEQHMIGDNTGDNISHKNREYCELTSIYWAWKNQKSLGNPEYIGFMHYRRHLCFNLENKENTDKFGLLHASQLDDNYLKKCGLNDVVIQKLVKQYDIITVEAAEIPNLGSLNNYDHYKSSSPFLHIKDYDIALDVLTKLYPEYKDSIQQYNQSTKGYFTNIFIFRKELFNQYAQWLFSILDETEKRLNIDIYNVQEARVFGYISEWLFGIWYTRFLKQESYKSIELKRTLIQNTNIITPPKLIDPAFKTNNIAICLAADQNYVNYLAVTIQSFICHSNYINNYDINIIYSDISEYQKKMILNTIKNTSNFSIRFININHYFLSSEQKQTHLFESGHITVAAYYRLFIPLIFKKYNKIVYLDCDLVVNRDVADLFNHELSEDTLAGVIKDTELIRWYCSDKNISEYIDKKLQFKNVMNYFNSGVLLLNVYKMNKENIFNNFINILTNQLDSKPKFHDQDILNKAFENRTTFLDLRWNVLYHIPIFSPAWKEQIPASLLYPYIQSRIEPYIIHFAGCIKPWHNASKEMASYFWHYARMTDFYENILHDNRINFWKSPISDSINRLMTQKKYAIAILKYYKYKILSKIRIGETRKYYKSKQYTMKSLLKSYKFK